MHLVSIIYPVESVVTIFSWAMFFLKKDDMLPSKSPDGKQLTTLPFEITHYCLHLLPLIGLMADYATHFRHYIYSHLQAVSLAAWGFGYLGWMCFCRYMDSVSDIKVLQNIIISPVSSSIFKIFSIQT